MADIRNPYVNFGRHSADLCLFILVAEQGQLSKAAQISGLSQPRLSQRIKALEDSLNRQLFVRGRRGVTLTDSGRELLIAVQPHLSSAADEFSKIVETAPRQTVVIQTDIAFASFRLLPVFSMLCETFSDLSISLVTVQIPQFGKTHDADLSIQMDDIHDTDATEICLFRESVTVVCSPTFKAQHPKMQCPQDILGKPLLDLSTDGTSPWVTWSDWITAFGLIQPAPRERMTFSSYDHIVRTAEAGLGVALGWQGLIDDHIEKGLLVQAIPNRLERSRGYYLKMHPKNGHHNAQLIFNWIAENI